MRGGPRAHPLISLGRTDAPRVRSPWLCQGMSHLPVHWARGVTPGSRPQWTLWGGVALRAEEVGLPSGLLGGGGSGLPGGYQEATMAA